MKKYVRYFIYFNVMLISKILVKFYALKNCAKKRILIYTDSRGFEITKLYNRKNPFSSYARYFIRNYNCEVYLCTEKHTTLFDFFYIINKKSKKYDFVILNTGVVDFSPRPISQINAILDFKKNKIVNLFGLNYFESLKKFDGYDTIYMGEKTSAILPENYILNFAEKFEQINNLIWITCNPVDVNWRGNYSKSRPLNINMVNEKSKLLLKNLNRTKVINYTDWSLDEVHKYTCDNIHYSLKGMNLIENNIKRIINEK